MDVATAFLNPLVEGDIYMELPEGLQKYYADLDAVSSTSSRLRSVRKGSICKLKKALYGLKEAPRLWHGHIDAFLSTIGFKQSTGNPNLYNLAVSVSSYLFLLLYVDDLLIACHCRTKVNRIKKLLSEKYQMTDLSPA